MAEKGHYSHEFHRRGVERAAGGKGASSIGGSGGSTLKKEKREIISPGVLPRG